jgi:hypothetical protein
MSELSVADQQLVDVASALARDLRVLIVDEPTASLTPTEVAALFVVLRRLRDTGVAIVFIGHRLEEILQISDRITVLRDGSVVRTVETAATDEAELVRLMVGRDISAAASRQRDRAADVVLEVRGCPAPASSTTSRSRSAPGRSSGSVGWSAPGAPSCWRPSSGDDAEAAVTSWSVAPASAPRRTPSATAWPSSPRTVPATASCSPPAWETTSRHRASVD